MKKITRNIYIIVIAVCLLFSLSACNNDEIYNRLNEMTRADYSQITLKITSEKDGDTLQNVFSIVFDEEQTTVSYTCQEYSTFEKDGAITVPTDYIVTSTGNVVIRNGKIEKQNGDSVDFIDFNEITALGISFNKTYFKNVNTASSYFSADVINAKGFTGNSEIHCSNMTVEAKFDEALQLLTIKYVSLNGANIQLQYIFNE